MSITGESWLPLVAPSSESVGGRDAAAKVAAEWRQTFMVEYSGGGNPVQSYSTAAMLAEIEGKRLNLTEFELTANANANIGNATCVANADDELSLNCKCSCTVGAVTGKVQDQSPCDGANNTYACYRTIGKNTRRNSIYIYSGVHNQKKKKKYSILSRSIFLLGGDWVVVPPSLHSKVYADTFACEFL